ncbi:hypothetical protein HK102_011545, partial [Quaeritorhiza haematococci]
MLKARGAKTSPVRLFCKTPFENKSPFTNFDAFRVHLNDKCGGCFDLLHRETLWAGTHVSQLDNGAKLSMLVTICMVASLINGNISYLKEFLENLLFGCSFSIRQTLSRMGLCYHPSGTTEQIRKKIAQGVADLQGWMRHGEYCVNVLVDDFNRLMKMGLPKAENSPKLCTASVTANLALKLHKMLRLPTQCVPDLTRLAKLVHSALGSIDPSRIPLRPYFTKRHNHKIKSKRMYSFSMATAAGSQKDLHVFDSFVNNMKTFDEMQQVVEKLVEFVKDYLKTNTLALVGDFYVFRNALIVLQMKRTPAAT